MPNTLIKIKTPVWTGDIDQKGTLLHSTGIVGSLRWWTEAILRSMGKYACDPTSDERCPQEERNKKYCSACIIFGATGIRRTFRLNINGGEKVFTGGAINVKPSGRNRGWYLGSGVVGEINLEITPLNKDFDESLVLLPLVLASKWGGIGARTQHGYGVVEINDCPKIDFNKFKGAVEKLTNPERLSKLNINLRHENGNRLPDFKEMFFAKVQFEVTDTEWWKRVDGIAPRDQDAYMGRVDDPRMIKWIRSGSVPIAPAIKNWLRYGNGRELWETSNRSQNRRIENWLFGTIRNGKTASKINISCAYLVNHKLWEFRIWGWIPKDELPAGFNRDGFLVRFKQALDGSESSLTVPWNELLGDQTKNHKLKIWREYNSLRDTIKPNESNIGDYIQSLLIW